jgi:hypothetical protein
MIVAIASVLGAWCALSALFAVAMGRAAAGGRRPAMSRVSAVHPHSRRHRSGLQSSHRRPRWCDPRGRQHHFRSRI